MRSRLPQRGFTLIELMIVVSIIGVLASIAIPSFLRFQARARQAEVGTNLKSLYTSMRTLQRKPVTDVHATGFTPERGNRYSYHLDDSCTSFEDRRLQHPTIHPHDTCIGADTFKNAAFPDTFTVVNASNATWNDANGMVTNAGVFGDDGNWDFLAYGAGDVDNNPADGADTWLISSAEGEVQAFCPSTGGVSEHVTPGEPFNVNNDVNCN
jgi:type IV pilus assembly protein PilA